ncbi:MAG: acyl-CoA dehydrogenase family protein, partial [Solirubrobacterales bacterium]
MDFEPDSETEQYLERIRAFMDARIYPREAELHAALDEEVGPGIPYPAGLVEIRDEARSEGLWNLFLPDDEYGGGLTNTQYAFLCEEMGRSPILAPMAFNCAAPDTGNMEILAEYGTEQQRDAWLAPLLEGTIRSCFSMTEPETSGSDPTGLAARAELVDGAWVINGRKWYTSGANGASVAIAMVNTEPDQGPYQRASMILVPTDSPGFEMIRPLSVMGHTAGPGHWEVGYEDCRVPEENLLGPRGGGFLVAQDRLGPGRIHHCMRAVGPAVWP